MAEPAIDTRVTKAAEEILALFEEDQSDDFIALEVIVSSRVLDAVFPGTKLAAAIDLASATFSESGFWWAAPTPLRRIIELTRAELQRAGTEHDKARIIGAVLEGDPDFLSSVQITDAASGSDANGKV